MEQAPEKWRLVSSCCSLEDGRARRYRFQCPCYLPAGKAGIHFQGQTLACRCPAHSTGSLVRKRPLHAQNPGAHSWFAAVHISNGCPARTQCLRFFRRRLNPASQCTRCTRLWFTASPSGATTLQSPVAVARFLPRQLHQLGAQRFRAKHQFSANTQPAQTELSGYRHSNRRINPSKKRLNEESGVWNLKCPQCNHQFEIHRFELKKGKVQRRIIRLFYPDFL